jgi:ABC-2 type transport system ATP-binding protein
VIAGRPTSSRARRRVALAIAVLIVAAIVVAVWPRSGPRTIHARDEHISVRGGPGVGHRVILDAGLYLPKHTPAPAVIVAHGFGGSRASVDGKAQRLARDGFVVLTYSARGFGRSTGRVGLDSLDYEVPDARQLVDWLAGQPDVIQDGPHDPRVGVTGASYGGALALMVAGTDPRVDAVAAVATWNDLQQALFPNDGAAAGTTGSAGMTGSPGDARHATPADIPAGADGVFKQAWSARLISSLLSGSAPTPPSPADSGSGSGETRSNGTGSSDGTGAAAGGTTTDTAGGGRDSGAGRSVDHTPGTATDNDTTAGVAGRSGAIPAECGRLMPRICAAYTQVAEAGRITPAMAALLANSSPKRVVGDIAAPTLLVQGEEDTLFGLDQADANARAIAANGTDVAVTWFPGGHSGGGLDTAGQQRITDWFRYYLAGDGSRPSTAFRYSVAGPVNDHGHARHRTLQLPGYPGVAGEPAAAVTQRSLSGPAQRIVNPPGGRPAAITSLPGLDRLTAGALGAAASPPGQTARFVSDPVETTTVVTGSPTVTLRVRRIPAVATGAAGRTSSGDRRGGGSGSGHSGSGGSSGGSGRRGNASGGSDSAGHPVDDPSAVLYLSLTAVHRPAAGGNASGHAGGTVSDQAGGAAPEAPTASAGGPAGSAVAPIRLDRLPADGSPVTVTVHLPAVSYQLQPMDAFEVRVATTNRAFTGPPAPAVYRVSLAGRGTLTVPEAGGTRVAGPGTPPWLWIGVLVLAAIAVVGLVLAGRRSASAGRAAGQRVIGQRGHHRRSRERGAWADTQGAPTGADTQRAPTRADTQGTPTRADDAVIPGSGAATPLVVDGLRKQYPGGVVAVDDVAFTVLGGQVLGLLGPNGAGKTTILRMVMGLIAPSAGSVTVFGEPVRPGAPVLSRIGSFVEGSGFLPHASGRANLEMYWRATGRPAEDSHLADALAIAGLGAAERRKVKTYSQGMRQRLAIAQAMLGLPDLLLLDEPTNGLDPPQIHAMRAVLRGYADTGRTVLVSSHLLSEVEQTCSHAVVVARGRTIAAGTVADLVAASGEMLIATPSPEAARESLRDLGDLAAVESASGGVLIDLGRASLDDVLRRLLADGVPVTSAAPRNRLEDVFLDLVGAGSPERGEP